MWQVTTETYSVSNRTDKSDQYGICPPQQDGTNRSDGGKPKIRNQIALLFQK